MARPSRAEETTVTLRESTLRALAAHDGVRVAAAFVADEGPPAASKPPQGMPPQPGVSQKRDIPDDHAFDPRSLKPLTKAMWALSISLGHALTAHRQFSRLKSVSFSPDGMVGGRGYVMSVKDIRGALHHATEQISSICDALYDEINAPHWKPKLAELEKNDEDYVKLLEDAKGYMDDPEGEAEEDFQEVESRPAAWSRFKKDEQESGSSQVPTGGNAPNDTVGPHPASVNRPQLKQSSTIYSYDRSGNSSINPGQLGGPRVDHLDRGEQTGPFGSYNRDEPLTDDQWGRDEGAGGAYAYQTPWENDLSERTAEQPQYGASGIPGNQDRTPTEGFDFGIGYGNGNDAHGQGAGGYANPDPSGKGVYGPRAELPSTGDGKTPGTHLETVEQSTSDMGLPTATTELPNDGLPPVARSDYYTGPKGNDFDGVIHGETELPGDGAPGTYERDEDLPNESRRVEQVAEPYVRWDDDTHNMRPDYTYQRDPIQGPYAR